MTQVSGAEGGAEHVYTTNDAFVQFLANVLVFGMCVCGARVCVLPGKRPVPMQSFGPARSSRVIPAVEYE